MKRNKIEQRLLDAADALVDKVPSFETINNQTDWDKVAESGEPAKRPSWLVPAAIAATAVLAVSAVTGSLIYHFSAQKDTTDYGDGQVIWFTGAEQKPTVFGDFFADRWRSSKAEWDFSSTILRVDKEQAQNTKENTNLFDKDGTFVCSLSFFGESLSRFAFGNLNFSVQEGAYFGEIVYVEDDQSLKLPYYVAWISKIEILVSIGDKSSTSAHADIFYRFPK